MTGGRRGHGRPVSSMCRLSPDEDSSARSSRPQNAGSRPVSTIAPTLASASGRPSFSAMAVISTAVSALRRPRPVEGQDATPSWVCTVSSVIAIPVQKLISRRTAAST